MWSNDGSSDIICPNSSQKNTLFEHNYIGNVNYLLHAWWKFGGCRGLSGIVERGNIIISSSFTERRVDGSVHTGTAMNHQHAASAYIKRATLWIE